MRLGLGCGRRAPSEVSQPQPVGRLATGRVLIGALVGGLNLVQKTTVSVCVCTQLPIGHDLFFMIINVQYIVF